VPCLRYWISGLRRVRLRGGCRAADQVVERAERGLRTFAHGDDDLLVGCRRGVPGREYTRERSLSACIDFDFAACAERQRSLQPVRVRQQADLHEDTLQLDAVLLVARTIAIAQRIDLAIFAVHFRRLRRQDDAHVRQAAQLALQYLIGTQAAVELDQRDMTDDAGQID